LKGNNPYDQLNATASSFIALGANIKTQVREKKRFNKKS
jgi:hypothetical protein